GTANGASSAVTHAPRTSTRRAAPSAVARRSDRRSSRDPSASEPRCRRARRQVRENGKRLVLWIFCCRGARCVFHGREDQTSLESDRRLRTQSPERRRPTPPQAQQTGLDRGGLPPPSAGGSCHAGRDRRESARGAKASVEQTARRVRATGSGVGGDAEA